MAEFDNTLMVRRNRWPISNEARRQGFVWAPNPVGGKGEKHPLPPSDELLLAVPPVFKVNS